MKRRSSPKLASGRLSTPATRSSIGGVLTHDDESVDSLQKLVGLCALEAVGGERLGHAFFHRVDCRQEFIDESSVDVVVIVGLLEKLLVQSLERFAIGRELRTRECLWE